MENIKREGMMKHLRTRNLSPRERERQKLFLYRDVLFHFVANIQYISEQGDKITLYSIYVTNNFTLSDKISLCGEQQLFPRDNANFITDSGIGGAVFSRHHCFSLARFITRTAQRCKEKCSASLWTSS